MRAFHASMSAISILEIKRTSITRLKLHYEQERPATLLSLEIKRTSITRLKLGGGHVPAVCRVNLKSKEPRLRD